MTKDKWVWMPHPGHLIVSRDCKFFMNTYVGKYIVSTVGEYFPDSSLRKIFAQLRGVEIHSKGDEFDAEYLKKVGYETIGVGTFYETMVFNAEKSKDRCCIWTAKTFSDLDCERYITAEEAYNGHLRLCNKWSKK